MIRQGDVLLRRVKSIPESAKPVAAEGGRLILARGEATGHHHSFALSDRVTLFREDGSGGGMFQTVTGDSVALEHQEHTTLTVKPGKYEVRIQRTYQAGMSRRVAD